ncbi:hypothetical protein C8R46DRAFT_1136595, partial [Mycena filopes]
VKLKAPSSSTSNAVLDSIHTSLVVLKESADVFPLLKSVVGGVLALCDIAKRAKSSKSHAREITVRANRIVDVIYNAVPDATTIPKPMEDSIEQFVILLKKIKSSLATIALSSRVSRLVHLNRNEHILRDMKAELDEAYRDFTVASAVRVEVQQTQILFQQGELAAQQARILIAVQKTSASPFPMIFVRIFFGRPLIANPSQTPGMRCYKPGGALVGTQPPHSPTTAAYCSRASELRGSSHMASSFSTFPGIILELKLNL